MKPTLIPLIVTYNRIEFLKKILKIWLELPISKVVVVNNNSTDGTKAYLDALSKRDSRVIVIHLNKNLGGAGGFKKGLKFINSNLRDYNWIVLQDDDAFPVKKSIEYFLYKKKKNNLTAYMSAVFNSKGKPCKMNIPGFNPFKNLKIFLKSLILGSKGFHLNESYYFQNNTINVDFASFVGLYIHKDLLTQVGFPKSCFFLYADDIEYTLRITQKGFSIEFDPNLKFIHLTETLVNGKKIYKPIWKAYYTYRNNLILYRKLAPKMFPLIVSIKTLDWIFKVRFYSGKTKYLKILFKAIKDGCTLKCRQNNQEIIKRYY